MLPSVSEHVIGANRCVVAPSAVHRQPEIRPDVVAESPVPAGGVTTQGTEPMFYVAITPAVVKYLLFAPADASGGDVALTNPWSPRFCSAPYWRWLVSSISPPLDLSTRITNRAKVLSERPAFDPGQLLRQGCLGCIIHFLEPGFLLLSSLVCPILYLTWRK